MHDFKVSGARGGSRTAHNRKLSDDQVREIRALLKEQKISKCEIGRLYSVSSHTVRGIALGFNYRSVL